MKHYLFIFLYTILFASCESFEHEIKDNESNYFSRESTNQTPLNPANYYDFVGQIHHDLSVTYYESLFLPNSMDSIISKVNLEASQHPYFDGFSFTEYNLVPQSRIADLVDNSEDELDAIIDDLTLSSIRKDEFRDFVSTVLLQVDQNVDYEEIYNYIVLYESTLLDSEELSSSEKEYLLTVTSIIRHAVYAKKRRPKKNTDLDWYWLTAKFTGAAEGAKCGKGHAILAALKAGVIQNR